LNLLINLGNLSYIYIIIIKNFISFYLIWNNNNNNNKGLIGNVVVSYFSYAAPYGVAVIFFSISAVYIQLNWNENYGDTSSEVIILIFFFFFFFFFFYFVLIYINYIVINYFYLYDIYLLWLKKKKKK